MKTWIKYLLIVFTGLTFLGWSSSNIKAQGWEFDYTLGLANLEGVDAVSTNDNGTLICGYYTDVAPTSGGAVHLIRLDQDGEMIWEKYQYGAMFFTQPRAMTPTDDEGYLVIGASDTLNFAMKFDQQGDLIWETYHPGGLSDSWNDVEQTNDGGYIVSGLNKHFNKLDANGNILWSNWVEPLGLGYASSAIDEFSDGSLISGGNWGGQIRVVKADVDGNIIWDRGIIGGEGDDLNSVRILSDGNILVGGYVGGFAGISPSLAKLDADGNTVWTTFSSAISFGEITDVQETAEGNYLVTGTGSNNTYGFVELFDVDGNSLWNRNLNIPSNTNGRAVNQTIDGSFVVVGRTNASTTGTYAMKLDGNGNLYTHLLKGFVFHDLDTLCDTPDGGFIPKEGWIIKAEGNSNTFYGLSNIVGEYQFTVPQDNYAVTLIPPSSYWMSCDSYFDQEINTNYDTTTLNFKLENLVSCPLLHVDISTPLLRRCFTNTYTVNICNNGTALAENAYVEIELDPFLIYESSSLPYTSVTDNIYRFDLGNLSIDACRDFQLDVEVDCDAELGQTHCVEAHVYPDEFCNISSEWDNVSIEVDAVCEGDSIRFFIENVGAGNMTMPQNYLVIEDQIILRTGMFQLDAGQSLIFAELANGSTYRLEAEQSLFHPGNSQPSVSIEGCIPVPGPFTTGQVILYGEDDEDSFISIDCQENIGSYDPNDKRGFPTGYAAENYIHKNQSLEYLIRFQNTGTDTAFTVVIRDEISNYLDISTLESGVSSHTYKMDIVNGRTIKFTFDDIMLPDSNVNELASHGFVKFRIDQIADLPLETEIANEAAIYFDFNEAIITNQTLHTIGERLLEVNVENVVDPQVNIQVFPNPMQEWAIIKIDGVYQQLEYQLVDVLGRTIRSGEIQNQEIKVERSHLTSGIYFINIIENNRLIGTAKVVAK